MFFYSADKALTHCCHPIYCVQTSLPQRKMARYDLFMFVKQKLAIYDVTMMLLPIVWVHLILIMILSSYWVKTTSYRVTTGAKYRLIVFFLVCVLGLLRYHLGGEVHPIWQCNRDKCQMKSKYAQRHHCNIINHFSAAKKLDY